MGRMTTVTIPRMEYKVLKERAAAFDSIISDKKNPIFFPPPIRSTKKIISEFRKTGLYNERFLKSLERGLKRSDMFTD